MSLQPQLEDTLDWNYFDRFISIGNQLGTYDVHEFDPFRIPTPALDRCLQGDGVRAVRQVALMMMEGRIIRPEPGLFVLAKGIAQGGPQTRQEALALLPVAARTSAHLFQLLDYLTILTALDPPLKAAIAQWYAQRSAFDLVNLVLRAPRWAGQSHRDLLGLVDARPPTPAHAAVYRWIQTGMVVEDAVADPGLELLSAYHQALATDSEAVVLAVLNRWPSLRDFLPEVWLRRPAVWRQLLPCLSTDALVSWLPKVAPAQVLSAGDPIAELVLQRLQLGALGKSPQAHFAALAALGALRTHGGAHPAIEAALLKLFHHRLQGLAPQTGTVVIALDPAASPVPEGLPGIPGVSPRMAFAAMALTAAAMASTAYVVAYGPSLEVIDLEPGERIDTLLRKLDAVTPGPCDGASPLAWALAHGVDADAFLVLAGSRPGAASGAPERALAEYRERTGQRARWLGVSCGPHRLCGAPPIALDMLEARGFDATVPALFFASGLGPFSR